MLREKVKREQSRKGRGARMRSRACTYESVFNHLLPLRSIGRMFKARRDVLFHELKPRRL